MVMKIPALWFTVISRPSKETTFAWVLISAWINCMLWEMALICSSKSRLNSSTHPTTPNKTYDDATHRLEVNALVAIENEDSPTEARTESLHKLGFSSASRTVGVSSVAQVHAMPEGQVTLVGLGCVHQFARVPLVLEGVTLFATPTF